MKIRVLCLLLVIGIVAMLTTRCATQGSPEGGPRDSIPPLLLNSIPQNQALNFRGSQIYFEFDERIAADKLKDQLIIIPNTGVEYKSKVNKNRLILELTTPLDDSTTYSFNFQEGVTDITEKNPVMNFKLAFSTGPFIDSIKVSGNVKQLLSGEPAVNTTVGLYDILDTLNVYEDKPKYFTTVQEGGTFTLENIKSGKYLVYAWTDINKNLVLETANEAYAFRADTLDLTTNQDSISLSLIAINTDIPEVVSARSAGRYFEAKLNKVPLRYTILPLDPQKTLSYNFRPSEKVIRFYNSVQLTESDSILYYINLTDSLQQTTSDTVAVKFRETNKQPEVFNVNKKTTTAMVRTQVDLTLQFSKPVSIFTTDSVFIAYDTLVYLPVDFQEQTADTIIQDQPEFNWDTELTKLQLTVPVNWNAINDTIGKINTYYQKLDSLNQDTLKVSFTPLSLNTFNLVFKKGTFLSVEQDTAALEKFSYIKEDPEELGTFVIAINTEKENFWLELINTETKEIVKTVWVTDQEALTLSRLLPGKYSIRIKLDNNGDGTWSYGNILEGRVPEAIIHPGLDSDLRPNFEVKLNLDF